MKYFFSLALLTIVFNHAARAQFTLDGLYDQFITNRYNQLGSFDNVDGYPYLEKDFLPAEVFFKTGGSQQEKLRYNNFLDEMEMTNGSLITIVSNKNNVDKIVLNGTTYRVIQNTGNGKTTYKYYVELFPGNPGLLARNPVDFLPEKKVKSGYDEYLPPRFEAKDAEYYILINDLPEQLPGNKNKMFQFMETKGYDAKGIYGSQKLKFNEEGMVELFKMLNN